MTSRAGRRPRYEFRVWVDDDVARALAHRLDRRADRARSTTIRDRYLLQAGPAGDLAAVNLKVRRGRLEVKELVGEQFGLQRWSKLRGATLCSSAAGEHDAVTVLKRRRRFRMADVRAECSTLRVERGGLTLRSVAIEAERADAVLELRDELGLAGRDNVPVHIMLRRCGATDAPDALRAGSLVTAGLGVEHAGGAAGIGEVPHRS